MANGKSNNEVPTLVRTSILVSPEVDQAIRGLAEKAERPLSWEIRRALEEYIERQAA